MLAESRARGRSPGRLRFVLSGGGPVPPTLKMAWRDELRVPLVESYGQSELGGFVALGFPELEPDDAELLRVGPPLPDKEVRIVRAGRHRARPSARSATSCCAAASWRATGARPEKTAEATRGGWLRTGDLGALDDDGYLTMRSRRAELIEVAGVPWYPRDVEEALCRIEGIRQAALVGVADKTARRSARPPS